MNKTTRLLALAAVLALAAAAAQKGKGVQKQSFGKTPAGESIDRYTLTNATGIEVDIINYGGIVTAIKVPDRAGKLGDVALGFDSLDGYLKKNPYFGALIGRYGNRIGKARFTLDGHEYTLARNDGENSLHGGVKGFDKAVWKAEEISAPDPGVRLAYLSKDGEEGYPGNLSVTVTYTLTPRNELKIHYTATTDKDTVVNLTNHSYFNLKGQGEGDILGHQLTIHADRFTPVDAGLIPTGELKSVKGTPFDFTTPHTIGERINADDPQIKLGRGYDHNFVLSGGGVAVRVVEPASGRVLEVITDQPGVQFYSGNFLDGTVTGKAGKVYNRRYGFCLETQHFPDSPNKPGFPTTVLKPGARYDTTTIYRFTTDKGK